MLVNENAEVSHRVSTSVTVIQVGLELMQRLVNGARLHESEREVANAWLREMTESAGVLRDEVLGPGRETALLL